MKCIACNYPKDPPDWHDYECPMCRCPQDFYFNLMKPRFIPVRLYVWFWWKFKWPELKETYQSNIWKIDNLITRNKLTT